MACLRFLRTALIYSSWYKYAISTFISSCSMLKFLRSTFFSSHGVFQHQSFSERVILFKLNPLRTALNSSPEAQDPDTISPTILHHPAAAGEYSQSDTLRLFQRKDMSLCLSQSLQRDRPYAHKDHVTPLSSVSTKTKPRFIRTEATVSGTNASFFSHVPLFSVTLTLLQFPELLME